MGFFDKFIPKDWESKMTKEDIDNLEKQGCDVVQLRRKYDETHPKTVQNSNGSFSNAPGIFLEKLDPYFAVPRSEQTEFFKAVAGKPPMFGKDKWLYKYQNAQLLYAVVVQAANELYYSGKNENYFIVLAYTTDVKYSKDIIWLQTLAKKLTDLRDSDNVSKDCKTLAKNLRNPDSTFCEKISYSITGGVDAWCKTRFITEQKELPNSFIPSNHILPYLTHEHDEKGNGYWLDIPSKLYI